MDAGSVHRWNKVTVPQSEIGNLRFHGSLHTGMSECWFSIAADNTQFCSLLEFSEDGTGRFTLKDNAFPCTELPYACALEIMKTKELPAESKANISCRRLHQEVRMHVETMIHWRCGLTDQPDGDQPFVD
ncbi:hypothetical protein AVEN_86561-1 [Araneus ventricosus]|uniref:Uncharacterized protein n=1 Tax=Araneus ventricosus TaxID=182803 RepID=A0A4Y2STU1_ARAVE|nr:hypothetical protein AVEN_86561-1 [Araneus ventricosus]